MQHRQSQVEMASIERQMHCYLILMLYCDFLYYFHLLKKLCQLSMPISKQYYPEIQYKVSLKIDIGYNMSCNYFKFLVDTFLKGKKESELEL